MTVKFLIELLQEVPDKEKKIADCYFPTSGSWKFKGIQYNNNEIEPLHLCYDKIKEEKMI